MRGLARPRKDKVAIFDANARTIIITGVPRVRVYVPGCGSLLRRAGENKSPLLPARNHARAESQDQGKRCYAAADARQAIMHFYVSARSAGIVIGRVCFARARGQDSLPRTVLCAAILKPERRAGT